MNSFWLERIYTPQDENMKINLLIIISVLYKNIAQKSRIAISSNLTNSPFDFLVFSHTRPKCSKPIYICYFILTELGAPVSLICLVYPTYYFINVQ